MLRAHQPNNLQFENFVHLRCDCWSSLAYLPLGAPSQFGRMGIIVTLSWCPKRWITGEKELFNSVAVAPK